VSDAPVETSATEPTVPLPDRVGVLGGGRMGSGIAHALLLAGSQVTVVERNQEESAAARQRIETAVQASASRGKLSSSADEVISRLVTASDRDALSGCELVVEAVPEVLELKVEALSDVERRLPPHAVLASNTSSMSIELIASSLTRPEQFIGTHFFNPVPASKLVEIVIGPQTAPALRETVAGWVRTLGKTAVVVNDAPGFASSRLGLALGLEAVRMLEEGVASAADIDAAMSLGYGHPMGPLRLTDLVGLDVRLDIARYLQEKLGDRFAPPQLLIDKVANGELGRKSGRGFYDWS
jgi:3-hydroxybutyryl-CoA dehydrogenase